MKSLRTLLLFLLALCAVGAHALSVSISVYQHSNCGQANGSMTANVSGGTPPYTYAWSNGGTSSTNFGVGPGTYTLTVTDALLDQATAQAVVNSLPTIDAASYQDDGGYCLPGSPYVSFYAGTENGMPPDPSTGSTHTPGPYTFDAVGYSESWNQIPDACSPYSYYIVSIDDAPVGTYVTVNFTDGAGCPGTFHTTIAPPVVFPAMQVINTTGSCSNGNIGTVTIWIAPSGQQLVLRLRNAAGQYVPNGCSGIWVNQGTDLYSYSGLAPGTYHAVLNNDLYNQFGNGNLCADSLEIIIPDLGTQCGLVSGRVYVDNNANCAYNYMENLAPNTVVEVTPGPFYTMTNFSGQYSITLPYGSYTFTEQHPVLVQSCPLVTTVNGGTIANNNIGCAAGAPLDVQIMMSNGPARPGFQLEYGITVDNLTSSTTGIVTLSMEFDPALDFVSSTPAPSSIVGNTITWTSPGFTMTNAFQHNDIYARFHIPPDIGLIGSNLITTATLATDSLDVDLANNTATSTQVVTASFDPNDKLAQTSSGLSNDFYFIDADDYIDYTIRFQNTGTDTAFSIVITDTLPTTLDPGSIIWGASSHAGLSRSLSGQGIVKFIFTNILLPDSNVNEDASHGFTSFRIKPRLPLVPGTLIENIANIYFDFNPPVITEPSVLIVEFNTSVQAKGAVQNMWLMPNPTSGSLEVRVSDNAASGLLQVVSVDGRVVMQQRMEGPRTMLDVTSLARGLYMLNWHDVNGTITTQRFVRE